MKKQFCEVKRTSVDAGVEVVHLVSTGFEHHFRWFWFLFDWTIGLLLAELIRMKSYRIALAKASSPGSFIDVNGAGAVVLDQARQSFGPRRIKELFHIRTWGFNASSKLMQHFCEHAADAGSLDDVYNATGDFVINGKRVYPVSAMPDLAARFYLSCPNGQSVRNRYRLVMWLYKLCGGGKTLSIACGSAQPLIHAVSEMNNGSTLVLTDTSDDSLSLALSRAEDAGIADRVACHKVSFLKLADKFADEKFDTVEACGIFDYLSDDQVIATLQYAFGALSPGGSVIVSNMSRTRGANLLLKTYNWPIVYRTPEEFGRLIKRAGGKNVVVYVEPWGIHPVAIATA